MSKRKLPKWKFAIFALAPAVVIGLVAYFLFKPTSGRELAEVAWAASYTERGLPVPTDEPRVGFWSSKITPKKFHPKLGWVEPHREEPGILEIYNGIQGVDPPDGSPPKFRVLVLGGSVAFATYASEIDKTYFSVANSWLTDEEMGCRFAIYAGGAWKTSQELIALQMFVDQVGTPDMVVFVNGLNDIACGANADTFHAVEVPTKDGSKWTPEYHEHDYDARADLYLKNMRTAANKTKELEVPMLVVLQPALFEKSPLSPIEKKLLRGTRQIQGSPDEMSKAYAKMRQGLAELAPKHEHVFVIDCSQLFNGDEKTTFADLWHFSDVGHHFLGEELAPAMVEILSNKE